MSDNINGDAMQKMMGERRAATAANAEAAPQSAPQVQPAPQSAPQSAPQVQQQVPQQPQMSQAPVGNVTMQQQGVPVTPPTPQASAQPDVMTQGTGYNPTATSSTTVINNTKQAPNVGTGGGFTPPDSGGGFSMSKPLVGVICLLIVAAIVMGLIMSSKGGKGEVVEDTSDQILSDEELFGDDIEWIIPEETFSYGGNELVALRAAGYTGDEIEDAALAHIDAQELIKQAELERDAWIQEAIAPLYDATSQEYKDFISQTWLTLPSRNDTQEWESVAGYYTVRKNLDYEKVAVYGNQLFIKIYLDDAEHDDWFFLNITPIEYNKLKAVGNVIVEYTYCTRYVSTDEFTNVEDFENIFITSAVLEIIE